MYRNYPVCLSVGMVCKSNFSLIGEPILMQLYRCSYLKICMKED